MRSISSVFVLVLGLVVAAPAHAVTLSSPILSGGAGANGGQVLCTVSNVGKKPATVTMTIQDPDGDVVVVGDTCAGIFNGILPPAKVALVPSAED